MVKKIIGNLLGKKEEKEEEVPDELPPLVDDEEVKTEEAAKEEAKEEEIAASRCKRWTDPVMEARASGNHWILRIDKGEEIVRTLEQFCREKGIGVISDTDSQPLIIGSHLGVFAIATVGKINNLLLQQKKR